MSDQPSGTFHIEISERGSHFRGLAVNIWRINPNTQEAWVAKPVTLEWERLKAPFDSVANTLEIPGLHSVGFLQAWAEALRQAGVKPEGFSQQIDAMKAHLEDMRALVFKSGKPNKDNGY